MNTTVNTTNFPDGEIVPMGNMHHADDMAVAKKMHYISSVGIATIFMVIGISGNTLSMILWRKKSIRSSTGNYLIAQAVADNGVLAFFFLTDTLTMINPDIKKSYTYGVFYSYFGYPLFYLFVVCSIWLTVGVTVDRYIKVVWIAKAKTLCNEQSAKTGIAIIVILCFIINVPHFNTFYPVPSANRKDTDDAFAHTRFGKAEGSKNYEFWVHCMFLVLVPFFSILMLNMLIIRQIIVANRKMEDSRSSVGKGITKKKENQITRLLLVVSFTFLMLIALQCITQCFFMQQPATMNFELISEAFAIAKLGVIINSSINFFLYCISGQRFRKELINFVVSPCRPTGSRKRSSSKGSIMKDTDSSVMPSSSAFSDSTRF